MNKIFKKNTASSDFQTELHSTARGVGISEGLKGERTMRGEQGRPSPHPTHASSSEFCFSPGKVSFGDAVPLTKTLADDGLNEPSEVSNPLWIQTHFREEKSSVL